MCAACAGHIVHCGHLTSERQSPCAINVDRAFAHCIAACLLQPIVKVLLGQDFKVRLHVVVPKTAELGAHDFVFADLGRSEMQRKIQPGHEILLHPQLRHEKRVSDVFGVHEQMNLAIHWDGHLRGHNVVFRVLIVVLIKPKEILVGFVDQFGWSGPNFPSGPG